jgi:CDGSH-type Zn-finger protein
MGSKKETEVRVVVSEDGPYIVTGNVALSKQTIGANAEGDSEEWTEGRTFSTPPTYALCRCGRSNNKPFCDGAHAKVGFDGAETASREPYSSLANVFDGQRCSSRM